LKPGEVLLLENLRYYAEEEGKPRGLADDASDEEKKAAKAAVKESQKKFVADLASLGDVWINDAFIAVKGRFGSFITLSTAFSSPSIT